MISNSTTCDYDILQNLIDNLLDVSKQLREEDQQTVNECIEVIDTIKEEKPKKGIIKMALSTLKGIAGTTEFVAAVTEITQFIINNL